MINALKVSRKAFLIAALIYPQVSSAEDFTGADVLTWQEEAQASYFQNSVSMAAIVASRTGHHHKIVECINSWYGSDATRPERDAYIRGKLRDFPDFHPQGIILAVLEEACGEFKL